MRLKSIEDYRKKFDSVVHEGEENLFYTTEQELYMLRMVEEVALRFAEKFRPAIWASVKWTAFAYYKRLFLSWSSAEYSPRMVIMACFYLAMKIDEFYVTIDDFVSNISVGAPDHNSARILGLEPEIIKALNYNLTVHCPYRPFEGHLMEMKTRMVLLTFDLETIRNDAFVFFNKSLLTDVMLIYNPAQISLAAVLYGLNSQDKSSDVLKEYLMKLLEAEEDAWGGGFQPDAFDQVEKLMARLEIIVRAVEDGQINLSDEVKEDIKSRATAVNLFASTLNERKKEKWAAEGSIGNPPGHENDEAVDSDED